MVWFKRGLSLVLLAVLIYFFWPLLGELRAALDLFRQANWAWLVVAVAIQIVSYGFLTWLNALSLKPFGGKIGFLTLAALLTSMAFIQIAIPSAGASGVALRVRLLGRFGYKSEESLFSLFVESFSEIILLIAVALLGVVYLLQGEQLSIRVLFWIFLVSVLILFLLWYSLHILMDFERSRRVLGFLVSLWNRLVDRFRRDGSGQGFFRRRSLPELENRLALFQQNLRRYRQVPLWKFALATGGKVFLDVACLGAAFYLFRYAITPGTLLTGYGLILTFSGLAALPAGIGMADASVPVIFSWMSVPASVALAAGLVYRLIAFWLVRFVGFICWQILEGKGAALPPGSNLVGR